MERGVDWAVDDAGLEAGVCISKGYRSCHDTVAAIQCADRLLRRSAVIALALSGGWNGSLESLPRPPSLRLVKRNALNCMERRLLSLCETARIPQTSQLGILKA